MVGGGRGRKHVVAYLVREHFDGVIGEVQGLDLCEVDDDTLVHKPDHREAAA